jgi:hypothetical protein
MKKIVILILIAALGMALLGYVAAGPFIAMHQIKSAMKQQDSEKLSSYIDFPSLRANLKEKFNASFMKLAAVDLKDNPFQALAMAFASKLVEGMVDSAVTPAGLANLMAGEKPQQVERGVATQASDEQKPEPFNNAHYTYDSPSKFSARIKLGESDEICFVFTRNDLSWKLSNILLPAKLLDASPAPKAEAMEKPKTSTRDPSQPSPFQVVLRGKAFREADYPSRVEDAITIKVAFTNSSGKDVRAFDGVLGFTDLLDNNIYLARLAINEPVAAGAIFEWDGKVRYNRFEDSHRHLKNEKFENLKTYFEPRKILFADGTTKEFK